MRGEQAATQSLVEEVGLRVSEVERELEGQREVVDELRGTIRTQETEVKFRTQETESRK